ncbi:unnamed protein product [Caretta caretta]
MYWVGYVPDSNEETETPASVNRGRHFKPESEECCILAVFGECHIFEEGNIQVSTPGRTRSRQRLVNKRTALKHQELLKLLALGLIRYTELNGNNFSSNSKYIPVDVRADSSHSSKNSNPKLEGWSTEKKAKSSYQTKVLLQRNIFQDQTNPSCVYLKHSVALRNQMRKQSSRVPA